MAQTAVVAQRAEVVQAAAVAQAAEAAQAAEVAQTVEERLSLGVARFALTAGLTQLSTAQRKLVAPRDNSTQV